MYTEMRKSFSDVSIVFSPLVSIGLVSIASTFFTSFVSIKLEMIGAPKWLIGWMGGAYYVGMLLGSHLPAKFVLRVGHIRAYAFFASIMAIAILSQYFWNIYVSWGITRFLIGYALGALYLVIESWLFNLASPEKKGAVIGMYTFILYLGSFIGQIQFRFIDLYSPAAFIIPACIVAASLFPISATSTQYPKFDMHGTFNMFRIIKRAPVGAWNTLMSGLIISTSNVLLPVFLYRFGFAKEALGWLLAVPILGAICFQYPLGRVSDFVDRRKLMIGLHLVMVIAMVCIVLFTDQMLWLGVALFVFGCMFYSIYPIAMAYTCDSFPKEQYFGVIQTLLILYGAGSIIGPILAAYCMQLFHINALFWFLGAMSFISAIFSYVTRFLPAYKTDAHKTEFVSAEAHTPILTDINSR
jgi:MFS family permease